MTADEGMTRGVKLAIASVAVLWVGGMAWRAWNLLDELPSPERGAGLLYLGGGCLGGLAIAGLVGILERLGLAGSSSRSGASVGAGIGAGIGAGMSLGGGLSSPFWELTLVGALATTLVGIPLVSHRLRGRPPPYLIGPGARRR